MTTYYLSGPMRGCPDHNYPAFYAAEIAVLEQLPGYKIAEGTAHVLNPARNFDGDRTRATEEYMTVDIGLVLKAHVIVLLPGWEKSEGAKLEAAVASATGKRFILAEEHEWRWVFKPIDGTPEKPLESPRAEVLTEASALITGDRNSQYGPPLTDFTRTADILSSLGYRREGDGTLKAHDVAIIMIALKLSRLMWMEKKRDSWVDVAGYAGCGFEVATATEAA